MKKLLSIALALILCLGMVACKQTPVEQPAAQETVTGATETEAPESGEEKVMYIALCYDQTGANQAVGERKRDGTDYAVKVINESGGILGHRVEVIYYDTATEMQTNINAVKLALEDERISALLMPSTTSFSVAVLDDISEHKIPFLPIGSGQALSDAKNPYTWQLRALSRNAYPALVNYAVDTIGTKLPAILNLTSEVNIESAQIMRECLEARGVEVLDSRCFAAAMNETNFAPIVAQIKASGADCLFTSLSENTVINLSKAMFDAGLRIPVLGNGTIADISVLSQVPDEVEGWHTTAEYDEHDPREACVAFNEGFEAEYGYRADSVPAMQYDIVMLLKAACELGGSCTDRALINEGFTKIKDLEGLIGVQSYHDDHSFMSTVNVGRVESGALKIIKAVMFR